jgi:cytidylate kinase
MGAAGPLIVIDGPAGAGKSTVARTIAERLGATLLDTGAIYRGLALLARSRGISWDDAERLGELAASLRLEFRPALERGGPQQVWIVAPVEQPLEVTREIRQPEISEGASKVSAHPPVRSALLDIQRAIAAAAVAAGGCVAEGRDMGTVVFPEAPHKFFLTASSQARAQRRHLELAAKGESATAEQVEAEMQRRDQRDSSREAAPLQQAADAVLVDSSALDVGEVVDAILAHLDRGGRTP